jgi:hypothetical protein
MLSCHTQDATKQATPGATDDAATVVPRVFLGNSVQHGEHSIVLPIICSIIAHSCNSNTVRQVRTAAAAAAKGSGGGGGKEVYVEYVATRGIKSGDAVDC